MEQAIKKAIEGGYDWNGEISPFHTDACSILLDPAFWQALGKSVGWYESYDNTPEHVHESPVCWCNGKNLVENGAMITVHEDRTWMGAVHRFVDHIIAGKDIESFFVAELLTPNTK